VYTRRWPDPTSCTCAVESCVGSNPPRGSTCPAAMSVSFTTIAATLQILPHDRGGRAMNAAPFPEESTSMLVVVVTSLPTRECPSVTATEPLTAQHMLAKCAVTRVGVDCHC
jgi:hypothetical protein